MPAEAHLPLLPHEFVLPGYEDGSIANVPATVARLLGASLRGLPPLRDSLWRPLGGNVRRVVALVIDAWGWNLAQRERPLLQPLLDRATIFEPITSVFPSTTVAALSTLWTGAAPAQHGLVGLRLFFPEYGTIGQMLKFTPTFGRYPDALVEAGLDPLAFLQWPGFAEQLAAEGITALAFKGQEILHSALSKMHGRGLAGDVGIATLSDMLVQIRRLLERRAGEPLFVAAYWPTIDTLSHIHGWDDEIVAAELRTIVDQIQRDLLEPLSRPARAGTVLLIYADHGQVVTPPAGQVYLEDHPALQQMLLMKPSGEPRVVYLFAKQGRQDDVIAYINTHLAGAMVAWPAATVLEAGLLGPPPHATPVRERLGDVVVAMRGDHVLLSSRAADEERASRMRGRHGGLSADEMLVPWLALRLEP